MAAAMDSKTHDGRPGSVGTDTSGRKLSSLDLTELRARLHAPTDGLKQTDAKQRIARYGYNELPDKKVNPFLKFLSYLWGPIPWMIEIAAVLSAVVHHWEDFGIITVLLLMNAVVGFWEGVSGGKHHRRA